MILQGKCEGTQRMIYTYYEIQYIAELKSSIQTNIPCAL